MKNIKILIIPIKIQQIGDLMRQFLQGCEAVRGIRIMNKTKLHMQICVVERETNEISYVILCLCNLHSKDSGDVGMP